MRLFWVERCGFGLLIVLISTALAVPGCSVDPLDVGSLDVAILSGNNLVSEGSPGSYQVRVRNPTGSRVEWGEGSSACQISLFVITPSGNRYPADLLRACTEDLVTHALAGGQSRTETIEWDGQALINNEVVTLPDAIYRLVGSAGDRADSAPYEVQLVSFESNED